MLMTWVNAVVPSIDAVIEQPLQLCDTVSGADQWSSAPVVEVLVMVPPELSRREQSIVGFGVPQM
jgi:hypothetical protein